MAVGDLGLEVGRRASFSTDVLPVDVTVIDVVEVAPGRTSNRPVLVVPADSFLLQMLTRDPRLKPGREAFSRTQFRTELWVADGSAALDRTLEAADVEPVEVRTADQLRATPELVASSLGSAYQVAIGVVLALLAAGALAFHADRTAAQHRAADVLLARAGLGARGVAAGAAERPPGRHDPGRPVSAPTSHGADALVLRHVTHGQREHGHPVLADVDLHVARGEMVARVGRSGSGKSTVCQLAFGLERPGSGEVLVDGAPPDPAAPWSLVAFQPQRLGLAAELGVEENALLPCWLAGTAPPTEFLESLHIQHIRSRPAGLTSLGEQQRTGVGRALVLRPRLVLLDEPTAHQDDDNVDRVLGVVRAAAHAGSAVLVATHDPRVMATADRAVHLDGGRVVPAPD